MTSYVKLNLGIPGHAIVLTVLPFAFGMALVPRRWSGSIMAGSALATMLLSGHTGLGAIGSMVATGVLLDLALRKAKGGFPLYLRVRRGRVSAATRSPSLGARGERRCAARTSRDRHALRAGGRTRCSRTRSAARSRGLISVAHGSTSAEQREPTAAMITIGIDDTDIKDTRGTNAIAREILSRLGSTRRARSSSAASAPRRSARAVHEQERLRVDRARARDAGGYPGACPRLSEVAS